MKKTTKLLALLLAMVMCVGMLVGCNGQNATTETKKETTAPSNGGEAKETQEKTENEEPYEIVIELISFVGVHPDEEKVIEAINAITLPAINCTVKFLTVAIPDHATKLSLLAAGGEKLDLVAAGITVSPVKLVQDGVLTDITDLVDTYAPDLMKKEGGLVKAGIFNERMYTLSASLYPGGKAILGYNKDMANEYGIEVPESLNTWEEWDAFLAQCKEKLPEEVYPLTLGDGGAGNSWNLGYFDPMGDKNYLTYGVMTDIENGTEIVNWYETEEYKQILEKKHEWYEAGYCVPDSMTSGFTVYDSLKAKNSFACIDLFSASRNEAETSTTLGGITYGTVALCDSVVCNSDIYMNNWGIPITSERPEKVLEFLNLLFTNEELMNTMNYGIEGVHYVQTEEGSSIITYPEGVDGMSVGWTGSPCWYGDHAKAYIMAPNTEAYYENLKTYNTENSKLSNALGYTFDTSSLKTELAAVQTVIDTYRPSLECGLVDVDTELPKFIEALKEAGIDKVIEENQKQYTEWLSSNK